MYAFWLIACINFQKNKGLTVAKCVRVALDLPLEGLFDYRVAEDFSEQDLRRLVWVPFGQNNVPKLGVALELFENQASDSPYAIKEMLSVFQALRPLPEDYIDFCRFAARYYHVPLGQVIFTGIAFYFTKSARLPRELKKEKKNHPPAASLLVLNEAQQQACHEMDAVQNRPILLFGVTGSGKTEVYFQQIERTLKAHQQVLILVPEINLTPQLENRLKARFPQVKMALLHSDLSPAKRAQEWVSAFHGKAQIILGTRLAIFTPLPNLGCIVVDEEHDSSFKQQEGFRYHARDLAVFRAHQLRIPIILGSATPSIESWNNAALGRYVRVNLTRRAKPDSVLPNIATVNLKKITKQSGFSTFLLDALSKRLANQEQSLIFVNRRGFAPVLSCSACGWILDCADCSAHMVFHAIDRKMRCHHCGRSTFVPQFCACCGNQDLFALGSGTERVEENLKNIFPQARILRIDRDSVKTRAQWKQKWEIIENNQADILVGTQMLSKGHDFQNLTLVGILGVDGVLFSGDFRSEERLFALLTQVAGRAGRSTKKGEVLIETHYPEHPLFDEIVQGDFVRFAQRECQIRREAAMPPFSFQALLRADSFCMEESLSFLKQVQQGLPQNDGVFVFDPVPMNLARLAKRERAQMLLESTSRASLHAFLNAARPVVESIKKSKNLRFHLEIDPLFL